MDSRLIGRRIGKLVVSKRAGVTSMAKPKAVETAEDDWVFEPRIQGFGIGRKQVGGEVTEHLALQVYVDRKCQVTDLEGPPAPPTIPSLSGSGEILVDVIEVGDVRLLCNTQRTARPALPGFGLAHPRCSPGTFGCLVRARGGSEDLFVLSNSHVLAEDGLATVGDPIFQPGESRDPADIVATFADAIPFEFGPGGENHADAAIARVVDRASVSPEIEGLTIPSGDTDIVRIGNPVLKSGRTTGLTSGEIIGRGSTLTLDYRSPGGGVAPVEFSDLVTCRRFTNDGDSGAAVLTSSRKVLGLVFAGSATVTFFCRIKYVLNALPIDIVTGPI